MRRGSLAKADYRLRWALMNRNMGQLLLWPRILSRRNFVVFHIGRSGSTVLTRLLNQHPWIHCDGEVFCCHYGIERDLAAARNDARTWLWDSSPFYPDKPLPFIRSRMPQGGLLGYYGIEIKFFHLEMNALTLPGFIESVEKLGFRNFVVLQRKNTLRVVVSSAIAQVDDCWHVSDESETTCVRQVNLDIGRLRNDDEERALLSYLESYEQSFRHLKELLSTRHHLWLTYEDDVAEDPKAAFGRVCKFLCVSEPPVKVSLRRTNPAPIRQLVTNFDEVSATLRDTEFAWMLEE